MKQGTKSILFGCHSVIHSILVFIAWIKIYGRVPNFMQTVCIFLHDVGHIGLNYLDDVEEKKKHWTAGAIIAYRLFGYEGYMLTAGHCEYSYVIKSKLYFADKVSWSIAPYWWLYWNSTVEPELNCGMSKSMAIEAFRSSVKSSVESGRFESTHSMYLRRRNNAKENI